MSTPLHYFLLLVLAPSLAIAHTSDQRYVDGFIVDLSTAPVAPWVGEKVGMSFVFRDPVTGLATTSIVSASLSIDALMREKSKVQETIFRSPVYQVDRGGFVTDHVFTEVGTFDVHLVFVDDKGREYLTGFRKQIRNGVSGGPTPANIHYAFIGVAFIMSVVGFVLGRWGVKH